MAYNVGQEHLGIGFCLAILTLVVHMPSLALADVYMHNPRGSNDRNCDDRNSANRDNGNRLFDSQNNAKGGYNCPRSFPFPCHMIADSGERSCCNNQNRVGASKSMVDRFGNIVPSEITKNSADANCINFSTVQPTQNNIMYYYEGSVLNIQWTNQHGFGQNNNVHSNVVIQYACDDTLTDNCGEIPDGKENEFPFGTFDGVAGLNTCYLRDGYPVNNKNIANNAQRDVNGRATETIPFQNAENKRENQNAIPVFDQAIFDETNSFQDDYRYGRHETVEYYRQCRYRERNMNLFPGGQIIDNFEGATATRQNPNGNDNDNDREGYECPEERDYYPYWHWTPWKDIANIVSDPAMCDITRTESGNVIGKGRCTGCTNCRLLSEQPNNRFNCETTNDGTWVIDPPHFEPVPKCVVGVKTRVNHLGDTQAGGQPEFNWTIPAPPDGAESTRCTLRIRYNISTGDHGSVSRFGDVSSGDFLSDDDGPGEVKSYKMMVRSISDDGESIGPRLGINVNANQHGRVFQDRSYVFEIRKRPSDMDKNMKIHNVNVRGKRGGINDAYPATEYDFVPSHLVCLKDEEAVHIQWTGSDYNPSRTGDAGEGGPVDPEEMANILRCDRSNLAEMAKASDNRPVPLDKVKFFNKEDALKMALLSQTNCRSLEDLRNDGLSQEQRERHHQNCAKLNSARIPYFDGGVHKCTQELGTYHFLSTRNNNFSNRQQKLAISVALNSDTVALYALAALSGLVLIAAGVYFYRTRKKGKKKFNANETANMISNKMDSTATALSSAFVASTRLNNVTAKYDYRAKEANELAFKKGDTIQVTKRDPSGWWEGTFNGKSGFFPSSYVV